ncbi:MAG: hypothetical protein ACRDD7_11285 [Peptostreptococcaceae bacterium]
MKKFIKVIERHDGIIKLSIHKEGREKLKGILKAIEEAIEENYYIDSYCTIEEYRDGLEQLLQENNIEYDIEVIQD